ncbi:hypothetical protein V7122_16960 [Bacillus sp. JJ1532]|uniref:hypothetical protein n=1 Tax=Bacillus sp. JJ1532 TaxID=3122958 RepID=UPI002FFEBE30
MNKIIYNFDDLTKLKELDFYHNECLLVNGVSLFGIKKINVVLKDHDMISIKFMKSEEKVAAIFVTKGILLEVKNRNIIEIKNPSR